MILQRNMTKPLEQYKIIGIIFMVPVYVFACWFSIALPEYADWAAMGKDVYEGIQCLIYQLHSETLGISYYLMVS